jgi:hypothetical protein
VNLLLRPIMRAAPGGGQLPRGRNNSPWLSFKDQPPQRTRRQIDDDELLLLLSI